MDIKQLHKMLTLLIINLDESFNALQASQELVEDYASNYLSEYNQLLNRLENFKTCIHQELPVMCTCGGTRFKQDTIVSIKHKRTSRAVEFIGSPKLIYTCIDCSKETGRD